MIVSVKKVGTYDTRSLDEAVEEHFQRLGIAGDLKPEMKVLIKPNLLAARTPDLAVTTHPELIAAVARWLRAHGISRILLADSCGGLYNEQVLKKLYSACGMKNLEPLVKLNLDVTSGTRNGFSLLTPVLEADYIIDCCKLKTHSLTVMTGAVKNLFGCIPGLKKAEWHCKKPSAESFAEMLIDLCDTVHPDVCLMDAVDCMEGNGPGGGTVRHMGVTLAARSAYHLDEQAARLMGINPEIVPMIRAFRRRGKLEEQTILQGDELVPAQPPFRLPDTVAGDRHAGSPMKLVHRLFAGGKVYPRVNRNKCIGCGRCAESCPKRIITVKDGKADMAREGCISCFCCQEMCPAHAIEIEKE